MASWFVGLPKRYLTDVDLSRRTTTGDPEGSRLETSPAAVGRGDSKPRSRASAATSSSRSLPASAVKIGGERAYRLHRRGVAVEMPRRRSHVAALDVIAYTDGIATLDLRVSSGTYVRSIADALGGHCVALRRTEVGPFAVAEADPERIVALDDALGRIGLTAARAEAELRQKARADREAAARERAGRERGTGAAGP